MAARAAFSTAYHRSRILGLACLHRDTMSGSSSSVSPMFRAPMAIRAEVPPWYPRASVATFPFCRREYSGFPFAIRSTGTPNICAAVAS